MRSTLSPAFTSSKMRTMFALIKECAENFTNYFQKKMQVKNEVIDVEMKDIFTRYTNDVIATTAFGIKCDSLTDQTNEFYMAGKEITTFKVSAIFKMIGFLFLMPVMKVCITVKFYFIYFTLDDKFI